MTRQKLITLLLLSGFVAVVWSNPKSNTAIAPKVIFDTDMGSDCDDVGALALLHAYADMGKVEIVGCMYSSGNVPYGAAIIQAINIYYGRPDIPIGACFEDFGDPVDKMTAEKLAKDTTAFGNTIVHNRDAQEQTRLCRALLAAQKDQAITYVTVGHTKGLYDLLQSEPDSISSLSGIELVKHKVNRWVALGALNAANKDRHHTKDWNFFFNGTAPYTKYLVEHFPAPIYYVDAGANVFTGKSLQHTPPGTVVRTAYRDWLWNVEKKTLEDQRPSWDLAAVYFAVEGYGDFLVSQGRGWLEFDVEKGCRWNAGHHKVDQRFVQQKQGVSEDFAATLNTLIARPPTRAE